MKPIKKKIFISIFFLLLATLVVLGWYLGNAIPIGTGYVAKYLCSSTFISKRAPEIVYREDIAPVNPIAKIVDWEIDHEKKTVTSTALGAFPLRAIYRDGCGCSLVINTTEEEMRGQKLVRPGFSNRKQIHNPDISWPRGSRGPVDPAFFDIDPEKLKIAVDLAFSEPGTEKERMTRAVVIVYDGHLIYERYALGFHKDMPLLGWSISKSVTNALIGILVRNGKLDIDKPAPVPEWQDSQDQRRKITLDHLLRMSSGLEFEEIYAPLFDVTYMLYGEYDFASYAANKPLETTPDSKWLYSSGTANIVARMVRTLAEKDYEYYYDFIYEELFGKIGMYSAVVEPDSSGTFAGSAYANATPRDWARFGLLYLRDGVWNGERILPEGWVKYTTTPAPKAPQGKYGAMFWLNAGNPSDPKDRWWPNAPQDTFAAQGFQEQRVIVIPSKKLVLIRFGATSRKEAWSTDEFIKNVIAAL